MTQPRVLDRRIVGKKQDGQDVDGALGFWKALPQVWPTTRAQRCWVHKTANVLDKMAKKVQPGAKTKLHEMANVEWCQVPADVIAGVQFIDGEKPEQNAA